MNFDNDKWKLFTKKEYAALKCVGCGERIEKIDTPISDINTKCISCKKCGCYHFEVIQVISANLVRR